VGKAPVHVYKYQTRGEVTDGENTTAFYDTELTTAIKIFIAHTIAYLEMVCFLLDRIKFDKSKTFQLQKFAEVENIQKISARLFCQLALPSMCRFHQLAVF
jgi:hypothetical protein